MLCGCTVGGLRTQPVHMYSLWVVVCDEFVSRSSDVMSAIFNILWQGKKKILENYLIRLAQKITFTKWKLVRF